MIYESTFEKVGHKIICFLLLLMSATMIIPFLYVFSMAISPEGAIARNGMLLLPIYGIDLSTIKLMIKPSSGIMRAYANTIGVTLVGTSLSLIITSMLGYVISKNHLPGRNIYKSSLIFTMLFSGGLMPTYFVVKSIGLINTYWAMIIPGLVNTYNVMLLMRYFESIPPSLEESAKIDGANDIYIFFIIYVPISLPILMTIGIFLFDAYWNQWFGAMIYVTDENKWPIQVILRQLMQSSRFSDMVDGQHAAEMANKPNTLLQCAVIVVAILPLIVLFPFMQKYFVKGIMLGAVKE